MFFKLGEALQVLFVMKGALEVILIKKLYVFKFFPNLEVQELNMTLIFLK